MTSTRLDDGRTLIISSGADRMLQRWDAATGEQIGGPLMGHTGEVQAVTSTELNGGRTLIISGDNLDVILWPLRSNGQITNEPTIAPRVGDWNMFDEEIVGDALNRGAGDGGIGNQRQPVGDALNRGVLAAHLEGLLFQLITQKRSHTAVVHIDGRWGAGKSTLVSLLVERLGAPSQRTDTEAKKRLINPVVVWYDAWRESTVAPEWWSLARSINMAVRSQRAPITRGAMTVTGAISRTVRSQPVLVAAAVLLVAWASGLWKGDVGAVGEVLTTAATLATLGLALGRVLFWAAPAFAWLHQRADDNPLGEIAATVASLRRWSPRGSQGHRRPVLLVIDDLDRCSAERVVKLMETVHTLLREPAKVRLLPGWRLPAPLIVLMLADGRWVRAAFETRYESFSALGSPVHGLGADFQHKVFDHIVLVPTLATDQVQTYLDHLTETSSWVIAGRTVADQSADLIPARAPTPGQSVAGANGQAQSLRSEVGKSPPVSAAATPEPAPAAPEHAQVGSATQRAERLIAGAAPDEVHNQSVRAALDDTTGTERERLAEAIAVKDTTTEALAGFREDLLTRYTPLMPANPRLVKRVANTFGMLRALGLHLDHHEDQDTIARAAILLVRFPTLVDELLSAADPPVLDPLTRTNPTDRTSPWLRRDVQQVLRRADGSLVDIVQIARCYGQYYAPDPASSLIHQPTSAPSTLTITIRSQPTDTARSTSQSESDISEPKPSIK